VNTIQTIAYNIIDNYKFICPSGTNYVRIAVIGDSFVGKTSLIKRFTSSEFSFHYTKTLGFNVITSKFSLSSFRDKFAVFIDFSGEKCFSEVRKVCYGGVNFILAVCDVTNIKSLVNLEYIWIKEFLNSQNPESQNLIFLQVVGNKADNVENSKISFDDLRFFSDRLRVKFPQLKIIDPCLVSAKSGSFVDAFF
jgi:small GTP-binding protein